MALETRDHFLQRRDVAEHRIDAFEDDQLAGAFGDALQPLFERFDVVVAERHDLRIAERAAVVDRGVAVDVEDDVVVFAGDGRNDAEVRLVAGRKDHGVVHGVEVLERLLDGAVADVGAVEDAAAGRARAEFVERLLARGDDVGVEGHAHVIVGAEQDRALAVADGDGRAFDLLHDQVERVGDAGRRAGLALLRSAGRTWRRGRSLLALSCCSASTSWPTVSISACMFMLMRTSNSSSTLATKSITVRLSHSRSWAKRVASVTATPFLLKGSISSRTLA